jgi:hypothetical protein
MNVTLTSGASTVTCNPISSCTSSGTTWPSLSANSAGTDVTVTASYTVSLPIPMFAPGKGAGSKFSPLTLAAQSRQMVVY